MSEPLFMVRTRENQLSGPFPQEMIISKIQNGLLRESDEICPGDGYWIFLHERAETRSLLGVELPRVEGFHEEQTETGTETATMTATQPVETVRTKADASQPIGGTPVRLPAPDPSPRPEPWGAYRLLLWLGFLLIAFVLFHVFRVARIPR